MTDTISDEAAVLALKMYRRGCHVYMDRLEAEKEIQAALTAARNQALEDAEKIARDKREQWSCAGGFGGHSAAARIIADAIRAMKVEGK